jgi:hypothetical protein
MNWIHLAQDRVEWLAYIKKITDARVFVQLKYCQFLEDVATWVELQCRLWQSRSISEQTDNEGI